MPTPKPRPPGAPPPRPPGWTKPDAFAEAAATFSIGLAKLNSAWPRLWAAWPWTRRKARIMAGDGLDDLARAALAGFQAIGDQRRRGLEIDLRHNGSPGIAEEILLSDAPRNFPDGEPLRDFVPGDSPKQAPARMIVATHPIYCARLIEAVLAFRRAINAESDTGFVLASERLLDTLAEKFPEPIVSEGNIFVWDPIPDPEPETAKPAGDLWGASDFNVHGPIFSPPLGGGRIVSNPVRAEESGKVAMTWAEFERTGYAVNFTAEGWIGEALPGWGRPAYYAHPSGFHWACSRPWEPFGYGIGGQRRFDNLVQPENRSDPLDRDPWAIGPGAPRR